MIILHVDIPTDGTTSSFFVDHVFIVARMADDPERTLTLIKGELTPAALAAQLEIVEAGVAKLRSENPILQEMHNMLEQYINKDGK